MSSSPRPERKQQVLAVRGLVAAVTVILPLLAGCPGSLEGNFPPLNGTGGMTGGGTGGTSGVCDAPLMIFTPICSGCHSAGGTAPDFGNADVASQLINKTPVSVCPGAVPQFYVNPAKPAAGVLFTRLMGATCIEQMPIGGVLTPAQMQCVTDWVTSKLP